MICGVCGKETDTVLVDGMCEECFEDLTKEQIVFFVNKERDRIRNIVIDNLTLPNCKGLSERGKGFREGTTTAKKVLLIHIGENERGG